MSSQVIFISKQKKKQKILGYVTACFKVNTKGLIKIFTFLFLQGLTSPSLTSLQLPSVPHFSTISRHHNPRTCRMTSIWVKVTSPRSAITRTWCTSCACTRRRTRECQRCGRSSARTPDQTAHDRPATAANWRETGREQEMLETGHQRMEEEEDQEEVCHWMIDAIWASVILALRSAPQDFQHQDRCKKTKNHHTMS